MTDRPLGWSTNRLCGEFTLDEADNETRTESAAAECLTDEALVHLKTYKYSSVDKSYISYYILRHYVRLLLPARSIHSSDE